MDKKEKPIINKLEEISQILKDIKVDVSTIKEDIKLIKDTHKSTEIEEEIKKSWFFY